MLDELSAGLATALDDFARELQQAGDDQALYALQVRYLGKKGVVTLLRQGLASVPAEQRKQAGQAFNSTKESIEAAIDSHRGELARRARAAALAHVEDLTVPGHRGSLGSLHPLTQTRRELEAIFRAMGFTVAEGPHVEHELFNFDKLNIVKGHPARDMQDTFFVQPRGGVAHESEETHLVLRTHTSPVQVRTMLGQAPPVRVICPGTVFRRDDDATHSPMFHQIEGLYVDEGVTMADLKATLYHFVGAFFGPGLEVRFRPSYFPFVEPGAEFDVQCPFCRRGAPRAASCAVCKNTGWIELGGSGMVHPAVFEAVGYDPERVTGWAFGFGIDRMAMLRHRVPELPLFFANDLRFLEQFPC